MEKTNIFISETKIQHSQSQNCLQHPHHEINPKLAKPWQRLSKKTTQNLINMVSAILKLEYSYGKLLILL